MTGPNGASSAPKTLLNRQECYSGKKKDHTVKNVLLVNALLVILFLSDTYGGRVHDLRIAEATPYPLPAGSGLLQDLGFLAFTLPRWRSSCQRRNHAVGSSPWSSNGPTRPCTSVGYGSSMSTAASSAVASSKTGSACGRRASVIS